MRDAPAAGRLDVGKSISTTQPNKQKNSKMIYPVWKTLIMDFLTLKRSSRPERLVRCLCSPSLLTSLSLPHTQLSHHPSHHHHASHTSP